MKKTLAALLMLASSASLVHADGPELYQKHCSGCHHPKRYGLSAPPLIPEYFGKRKEAELIEVVKNGLPATNMPSFKDRLSGGEISEVVKFILGPAEKPVWGEKEILESASVPPALPDKAVPYDMSDFFMVVEGGAGKVHFMDGESFTLLGGIKVGPVHGGPKFDKNLRYSYLAARDGWVVKYDLKNLKEAGRVRAGISSRNIAISADSRHLAVANLLPEDLVIIDTSTMRPVREFGSEGAVGAVYSLRDKKKFIVAIKDKAEILIIDDSTFEMKKINSGQPFTDFFIGPEERYVIGTSREGGRITVIDLETGSVVKTLESSSGMPHLASAAVWKDKERTLAAFPQIGKPVMTVMELYNWEIKKEIKIKGPGFFARTLENIPMLWVDTGTDTIELIDKKTLEVAGSVTPRPGKKAMHIEFNKDGSRALISVWEDDGAVNIYDSKTLALVKVIPLKKPVGKYNATNKKF